MITIKTQINSALDALSDTYNKRISCNTELVKDLDLIKASLCLPNEKGDQILSTGYAYIDDYIEISIHAENAIVDAITNIDNTLIK